jgi:outer membrane receptor for ferrienterochelin and colicins
LNNPQDHSKAVILYLISHRVKLLIFIGLVLFCKNYGQTTGFLLQDKVSGQIIEFGHVYFRELKGQGEEQIISNEKGRVECHLSLPVVIRISSLGFQEYTDTIHEPGEHILFLSPEYYQLDKVVVTGQFRPQPVDRSIYKIEVLDNKQIRLTAANNLGELLKNEVSFQYRPEGVLGDFLRIRGLTGEYVKILIDGMPVTGRVADRIDLNQLSLYNVDHVEVIEGPMSVVYGSNALAGAINIITSDYSSNDALFRVNGYYETVGVYNFDASGSKRLGNHTISLNAARNFHAGWGPDEESRYKIWKPKLQYITGGSYHFRKKNFNLKYNTDFLHEELRDLGPLELENLYEKAIDSYHFTQRWNHRLDVSNTFSDDFVLNMQAGYSYYGKRKVTYINDLVNLQKTLSDNPDLNDTTSFNLLSLRGFVSNKSGQKFEYQTGFDLSYETAEGKRTRGEQYIADIAGFMNIIYRPVNTLSIQPGVRIIHNSKYKAPLIYALNIKYQPGNFTMRGNYAKGFRAPSLKQLYLEFIDSNHEIYGNPDLKAETADNISFSGDYRYSRGKHSFELGIDVFYNSIKNAIQLAVDTNRPGWGIYFNVEGQHYITKGVEASIGYHFFPRLSIKAGLLTTGRSRLDDEQNFVYSTDVVSSVKYHSPKYSYELSVFYKYNDGYLDFAGNFTSEGELSGYGQRFVSGYHSMDITLSKFFFERKLVVSTGIKNVFDVSLVASSGNLNIHGSGTDTTPVGYGRTFFIKLGYRFEKY